jgi:hypothetical protein
MPAKPQTELQPNDAAQQLSRLVVKANKGKEDGPEVKELRKFLDEHEEFTRCHTIIADSLKHGVMRKITAQPGHSELFEREYNLRRDDLGWKDASPLERLMIERVMLLWVRLLWCENYNAGYMKGGVVMRESEFADKQYTRAHARYVKAIESLAKLRQVQAITKAADAHFAILDMKEKTIRARIEGNTPKVFDAAKGLRAAREQLEQKRA